MVEGVVVLVILIFGVMVGAIGVVFIIVVGLMGVVLLIVGKVYY